MQAELGNGINLDLELFPSLHCFREVLGVIFLAPMAGRDGRQVLVVPSACDLSSLAYMGYI